MVAASPGAPCRACCRSWRVRSAACVRILNVAWLVVRGLLPDDSSPLAHPARATHRRRPPASPLKPHPCLTGDDGRPGGAMLHQVPVPMPFVGRTYGELVTALLLMPATASTAAAAAAGSGAHGANGAAEGGAAGAAAGAARALPAPWAHEVPLGLLRRKSENRGWRCAARRARVGMGRLAPTGPLACGEAPGGASNGRAGRRDLQGFCHHRRRRPLFPAAGARARCQCVCLSWCTCTAGLRNLLPKSAGQAASMQASK